MSWSEPQFLTFDGGVVRIEDARDRLGLRAGRDRADIIAFVEGRELDRRGGARRPQPQRVNVATAPAGDRGVVGDGVDALGRIPGGRRRLVVAAEIFDGAAEADRVMRLRALELPGVAAGEPVLRPFLLPAVVQPLFEQAVLVADAVAVGRNAERRHRIHEAGGQPPEPAIAERGVRLGGADAVEIDAEAFERAPRRRHEAQIGQCIEKKPADEEFDRQVIDPLLLFVLGLGARLHPDIDDAVADGEGGRLIPVGVARIVGRLAELVGELRQDRVTQMRFEGLGRILRRRLSQAQLRHGHFNVAARSMAVRDLSRFQPASLHVRNMTRGAALDKPGPVEKPEMRA